MCGETGETLSATSAHSQQQSITQGLPDDTRDATDMADGIKEEDKLHLGCVHLVVAIQVLLYDAAHLTKREGGSVNEREGGREGGREGTYQHITHDLT